MGFSVRFNRLINDKKPLNFNRAIREANNLTDQAIIKYVDDYIQHFNNGIRTLDAETLGFLYKNSIELGQVRHTAMGEEMFSKLDDLYVETTKPVSGEDILLKKTKYKTGNDK